MAFSLVKKNFTCYFSKFKVKVMFVSCNVFYFTRKMPGSTLRRNHSLKKLHDIPHCLKISGLTLKRSTQSHESIPLLIYSNAVPELARQQPVFIKLLHLIIWAKPITFSSLIVCLYYMKKLVFFH